MTISSRLAEAMADGSSWLSLEPVWYALAILLFYALIYLFDRMLLPERPRTQGFLEKPIHFSRPDRHESRNESFGKPV